MVLRSTLTKRLVFSAILIAIAIYLIFFAPVFVLFLGVATIILIALNEFYRMIEKRGLPVHRTLGLIFGACVLLTVVWPVEPVMIFLAIFVLMLLIAFLTPLPWNLGPPSLSSRASWMPVDAPEGTAARAECVFV